MKIWDIIKNVGVGVIREVVPGGGLLVGAINEFLPDEAKLAPTATGAQLQQVVSRLPPAILEKEFDVDIIQIKESNQTVRKMLELDASNPHSTRPMVAKGAFYVVAFVIVVTVIVWAAATLKDDSTMLIAVAGSWQFILAIIGPFVTLLLSYFGVLKTEHKNRLDAANGSAIPSGVTGIISTLLKR